jgi:hypothetical protein
MGSPFDGLVCGFGSINPSFLILAANIVVIAQASKFSLLRTRGHAKNPLGTQLLGLA